MLALFHFFFPRLSHTLSPTSSVLSSSILPLPSMLPQSLELPYSIPFVLPLTPALATTHDSAAYTIVLKTRYDEERLSYLLANVTRRQWCARPQQFPTCCLILERRVDVGLTLHHSVKLASSESHVRLLRCPAHVKSQVEDAEIPKLTTDLLSDLKGESRGRSGDKRRNFSILVSLYLVVCRLLNLWSQLTFG